ncbi:MAG: histidine kinase [Lachnospiraceae bacterium]|nr:histidine kinase [Lachnospiraceae bacterium]
MKSSKNRLLKEKIKHAVSPFYTIHARLFWGYSVLFLSIFLILEFVIYAYNYKNSETLLMEQQKNTCLSIDSVISQKLNSMDAYNKNALHSLELKGYLIRHAQLLKKESSGNELYLNARYCTDKLTELRGYNQEIAQINVYDQNMNVLGSGEYSGYHMADASKIIWRKEIEQQKSARSSITAIHQFEWLKDYPENTRKISVIRSLNNLGAFSYGYVETAEDYGDFFAYVDTVKADLEEVYIYNENNQCVYPYRESEQSETSMELLTDTGKLGEETSGKSGSSLFTRIRNEENGWNIILLQPIEVLTDRMVKLQKMLALAIVLSIFIVFVLSFFLSEILSKPLRELDAALKKMNIGDSDLEVPKEIHIESSLDEIQRITGALNRMQKRIVKSVNELLKANTEQVQAQMLAIQNQMNPHFLYNNLTTISIMAEENMNDKIVCMCQDVTSMLRYISASERKGVTLGEELEHTMCYFNCLKIRYEELISLEVKLPEAMKQIVVPKLILQPLVENIAKYGLNSDPPWKIQIRGEETDEKWWISVEDSGTGFEETALETLKKKMREFDETDKIPKMQINGMGVLNIYIRMVLFFGRNRIFEIVSQKDGSKIILGARKREEEKDAAVRGSGR